MTPAQVVTGNGLGDKVHGTFNGVAAGIRCGATKGLCETSYSVDAGNPPPSMATTTRDTRCTQCTTTASSSTAHATPAAERRASHSGKVRDQRNDFGVQFMCRFSPFALIPVSRFLSSVADHNAFARPLLQSTVFMVFHYKPSSTLIYSLLTVFQYQTSKRSKPRLPSLL